MGIEIVFMQLKQQKIYNVLLLNVIFMKRKIKGIFTCLQRLFNVNENGNMNLNDEFCERFVWMACDDDAFDGAESFDLFDA